jgi:hypothetical protein
LGLESDCLKKSRSCTVSPIRDKELLRPAASRPGPPFTRYRRLKCTYCYACAVPNVKEESAVGVRRVGERWPGALRLRAD